MQHAILIEDDSQVGEARRVAAALSAIAGLPPTEAGRVAIVVNELGTNIRKHAQRGELLLGAQNDGVEVLAIDRGPGMDLDRSLRDGHSTAGTRGEGLGAVRRLAHEFDAFSQPGKGTVVFARIAAPGSPQRVLQVCAVSRPLATETENGDAWDVQAERVLLRLLVVDGLGHGPLAARAAQTAVSAFQQPEAAALAGPEAIVKHLHAALRSTRGAALAVAEVDLVSRTLRFCGIGNVAGTLDSGDGRPRGLVSHNGIGGHEARRIQEFRWTWPSRGVLVLASDGIHAQWKLDAYPGLHARHAGVIAGTLYRDFRRKTDDATVVVVKEP